MCMALSLLLFIFIVCKHIIRSHEYYNKSYEVLIRYKKSERIDETNVSAGPSTSKY